MCNVYICKGFSIGAESIVIGELASYFHKHYSIANSISQAGISIGVIIMPLLTQFFIDIYGWRGAMLLLGGIKLHSIISGSLLRPISPIQDSIHYSKLLAEDVEQGICKNVDKNLTNPTDRLRRLITDLVFYLDLSLFRDANFISLVLYQIGNGYCTAGWLIYLVPYGLEVGLEPYKASSLATFGGMGQLLGNLIFPFVIRTLNSRHVLYLSTLLSFLALMGDPLASAFYSYTGLISSSFAFGHGRGIAVLAFYHDCKETIDPSQMTNAVMWFHVFYSIGAILSGFLSGKLQDFFLLA